MEVKEDVVVVVVFIDATSSLMSLVARKSVPSIYPIDDDDDCRMFIHTNRTAPPIHIHMIIVDLLIMDNDLVPTAGLDPLRVVLRTNRRVIDYAGFVVLGQDFVLLGLQRRWVMKSPK